MEPGTSAAILPYVMTRDPKKNCGGKSPFGQSLESSERGYGNNISTPEESRKKYSLGGFVKETLLGGLTGGLTSAAFYGADKGIKKLKESVLPKKGGSNLKNILNVGAGDTPIPCATNIDINPSTEGVIFGDVNNLSQFASDQFDHVIALNPYEYKLLDSDVPCVLKEGGIMTVTGNYSNSYF